MRVLEVSKALTPDLHNYSHLASSPVGILESCCDIYTYIHLNTHINISCNYLFIYLFLLKVEYGPHGLLVGQAQTIKSSQCCTAKYLSHAQSPSISQGIYSAIPLSLLDVAQPSS